jgi:hypothetical protein
VVGAGIVAYRITRPQPPVVTVVQAPGDRTLPPEHRAIPESTTPPVPPPDRRGGDRPGPPPPERSSDDAARKAELARKSAEIAARKAVYNTIRDGSERAWSTCNQMDLLKRKEAGLHAARVVQDTNSEDGFRNQIRDIKANIADTLGEYSRLLDQLVTADATIAGEEFENYRKSLEARNAFQQIRIERVMKDHYERRRSGAQRVDVTAMGADCATAFGKGT